MNVTYLGLCDFDVISEPAWSRNSYGADTARLKFSGRRDKLADFEASLVKWQTMPDFGGMWLQSWGNDDHRSFPTVDLNYIGTRDGRDTDPEVNDSYAIQTVQATVTSETLGKLTLEYTYKASRTTYQWIEQSAPSVTPRYKTTRDKSSPLSPERFVYRKVTDNNGAISSISIADLTKLMNALTFDFVVNDYQRNQVVPNRLWNCSCSVDYLLKSV